MVTGYTLVQAWRGHPLFVAPCLSELEAARASSAAAVAMVGGLKGLGPDLGLLDEGQDSEAGGVAGQAASGSAGNHDPQLH